MLLQLLSSIAFLSFIELVQAECYVPGPAFPRPHLTKNDPALKPLLKRLDNLVSSVLSHSHDPSSPWQVNTTSFAIHLTSSVETLWTTHFTAPILGNYTDGEPTQVTGDTIFRAASSASKLFTAYASLLQEKGRWDDPITDFVPELKGEPWSEITLRALASHSSGLIMDCMISALLTSSS